MKKMLTNTSNSRASHTGRHWENLALSILSHPILYTFHNCLLLNIVFQVGLITRLTSFSMYIKD